MCSVVCSMKYKCNVELVPTLGQPPPGERFSDYHNTVYWDLGDSPNLVKYSQNYMKLSNKDLTFF